MPRLHGSLDASLAVASAVVVLLFAGLAWVIHQRRARILSVHEQPAQPEPSPPREDEGEDARGLSPPDEAPTTSSPPGPLRILLAEDNAVNQQVALAMLAHFGYDADVAVDGVEALAALRRQPYDLVLMDVQMPRMDGVEATRRIRAELPGASQPRIIAMTANVSDADRARCKGAGMDDFVGKPVQMAELSAAIARRAPAPGGARTDGGGEILDMRMIEGLRELGALEEITREFLDELPERLARLRDAAAEGDPAAVERIAHALKGSSGAVGARRVAEVSARLEAMAEEGRLEGANELLERLEGELHVLRGALEVEWRRGGG